MSKQFTGQLAVWFCNRAGNHNYLDNPARPMANVSITFPDGSVQYASLFLNTKGGCDTKLTKDAVSIKFAKDLNQPIFRTPMQKQS